MDDFFDESNGALGEIEFFGKINLSDNLFLFHY